MVVCVWGGVRVAGLVFMCALKYKLKEKQMKSQDHTGVLSSVNASKTIWNARGACQVNLNGPVPTKAIVLDSIMNRR